MFAWNDKYYKKYCICAKILSATIFQLMKNDDMKRVSNIKKSIELNKISELLEIKSTSSKPMTPTLKPGTDDETYVD